MTRRLPLLLMPALSLAMITGCKKEPVPEAAPATEKAETSVSTPAATEEVATTTGDELPIIRPHGAVDSKGRPSSMDAFINPDEEERDNLPERGVLSFTIKDRNQVFMPGEHWEQYNFPFTAKRWGRYRVRLTYTLKSSVMGVQLKLGTERVKKQLKSTGGLESKTYLGEIIIKEPGPQFMALYTPAGVGWSSFELHEITLIPTHETESRVKAEDDGKYHLLARHAITWSENMRYEPKPEKDCLGFWTEPADFAEWEFSVAKPGTYEITVHHGCGAGGGSEVAVELAGQTLNFKVEDTGGFQNWKPITIGKVEISNEGVYRLTVKPINKEGTAIMDVQKVVLVPVS